MPKDVAFICSAGKGRVIDFFLVSRELLPLLAASAQEFSTPWKPHIGLTFAVRSAARAMQVRHGIRPPPVLRPETRTLPRKEIPQVDQSFWEAATYRHQIGSDAVRWQIQRHNELHPAGGGSNVVADMLGQDAVELGCQYGACHGRLKFQPS